MSRLLCPLTATQLHRRWAMCWLLLALFLGGCMPDGGGLRAEQTITGRIAFLGADGNVFSVAPDGSGLISITRDAGLSGRRYGRPVWSADGTRLAFWGFDQEKISLYMAAGNGEWVRSVFESDTETPGSIAWSRSGDLVGFTTRLRGSDRLIFYVASSVTGKVTPIDAGVSSYSWDWGISDDRMAIQAGTTKTAAIRRSVLQSAGNALEQEVPLAAEGQTAPVWAPDGRSLAMAVSASSNEPAQRSSWLVQIPVRINRTVDDPLYFGPPTVLAPVSGKSSFAWSPSGQQIAVAHGDAQPFALLELFDLAQPKRDRLISEQPVLAFFWSPDGRRLAYFSPGADGHVRVYVFNVRTGQSHLVDEVVLSEGLRDLMTRFAEGKTVTNVWSPDSQHLVLPGPAEELTAGIWVYAVDQDVPPVQIARGDYATWSPSSFYR